MARRRPFRPEVSALEGRRAPGVAAVPPPAAVVPTPGNALVGGAAWLALHQGYVAQADRGPGGVVFLGDSITYFWDHPDFVGVERGLPTWTARIAPLGAVEFGIEGDQTQNLLWRLQHGELDGRPRVAVVLIGANNLLGGQSPQETAAGIAAVVGQIRVQSPQTRILLLGLLPAGAGLPASLQSQIDQVNATIRQLGDGQAVQFLNPGARLLGPNGTASPRLISGGTVHPTAAGYRLLAATLRGPILRLLDRTTRP
jgi:lysophospholipase L1-like esterase